VDDIAQAVHFSWTPFAGGLPFTEIIPNRNEVSRIRRIGMARN
jgi:hypothetical protein